VRIHFQQPLEFLLDAPLCLSPLSRIFQGPDPGESLKKLLDHP
jgi:hypothetical protein